MLGKVTLLGAGPGDEELLTVKGMRRLKEADVLVFDRLINASLLAYVRPDCELIDVGKRPGQASISQEAIEAILVEKAQAGKKVLRLKSGDPYVFGRGAEEGQSLRKAGIPFEVVPGLTSAIAGLTYAGIPITYRDVATSFHIFTGHLKDEEASLNWSAISQLKGTLVFLMGMKNLSKIVGQLLAAGYTKDKPVAIIEWATHPQQRSIDGNLGNILSLVEENHFKAPSLIVVGDVVAFRRELNFHEALPLFAKRVLIQESEKGRLPHYLKDAGASLVTFPARTKINPRDFLLPDLSELEGLIFADVESWFQFLTYLKKRSIDIRSLLSLKLVATGHHTIKAIEESGFILYQKNQDLSDRDWLDTLPKTEKDWLILAPQHKLRDLSRSCSLPIVETHLMDFESAPSLPKSFSEVDCICLPNSVAAGNFVALKEKGYFAELPNNCPIVVMGQSTRAVLEASDFTRIVDSDQATLASMRDKCIELVTKGE
ncbi:uroporphyrinogen-III C-methyltransferase [Streptococcus catagoni]|uniref:uroporphyrinogen-III C-methyltransferase n=1 Tax=Streptococcus catagoni TaxID=2654874 RepID=UPI00140C47C4|nr:uroporphyrinogen-III C-methyltransferase [Streptococcus catagoni]